MLVLFAAAVDVDAPKKEDMVKQIAYVRRNRKKKVNEVCFKRVGVKSKFVNVTNVTIITVTPLFALSI